MFSSEEIDILFKALDALESKQTMDSLFGMMLGASIISDDDKREEFMDQQKQEMADKEAESQQQRNRIILLKAKLIQMQDRQFVEDLDFSELSGD